MSTARSKLVGYTAVIKRDKEFALETTKNKSNLLVTVRM